MNPSQLSDAELLALVRQVDDQLISLQTQSDRRVRQRAAVPHDPAALPAAPEQQAAIERGAGEPFDAFWEKYRRALRRDLCLPGGLLYEKWQTWRDLPSKDTVQITFGILTALGIPPAARPALAVATTVFVLHLVTTAGIGVICADCAEDECQIEPASEPARCAEPAENNRGGASLETDSPTDPDSRKLEQIREELLRRQRDVSCRGGRLPAALDEPEPPQPLRTTAPQTATAPSHDTTAISRENLRAVRASVAPDGALLYPVWYGTDRLPIDPADHSRGYTGERGAETSYGRCEVAIPQSHKFGSVGSSWWQRLLTLTDDRLRLDAISARARDAFWDEVRATLAAQDPAERQALVFIHGYNVTFEEAAIRSAQIGCDLKVPGLTAFFSWPSRGETAHYPADGAAIESSEASITDFLTRFATESGAAKVHVIAHSMGNRGLLRALQRIQAGAALSSGVKFGQIILAAADLDVGLFRGLAAIYPTFSERTTLYTSPADRAVGLSRWLHDAPRVGFTPPVTVVNGIDTIEVPGFDLDALGHGYFAQAAGILHDIYDLIRHNTSPDSRQRTSDRLQTPAGDPYWRIIA